MASETDRLVIVHSDSSGEPVIVSNNNQCTDNTTNSQSSTDESGPPSSPPSTSSSAHTGETDSLLYTPYRRRISMENLDTTIDRDLYWLTDPNQKQSNQQNHLPGSELNSNSLSKRNGVPKLQQQQQSQQQQTTKKPRAGSNLTSDQEDPKALSHCCCGLLRITTACVLIAIVECLYLLIQTLDTIYLLASSTRGNPVYYSMTFTGIILAATCIFLLFVAIRSGRHQLLIPHLAMQANRRLVDGANWAYYILDFWGDQFAFSLTSPGAPPVCTSGTKSSNPSSSVFKISCNLRAGLMQFWSVGTNMFLLRWYPGSPPCLVIVLLLAVVAYLLSTVIAGTFIGLRMVTSSGKHSDAQFHDNSNYFTQSGGVAQPLIQASRTPPVVFQRQTHVSAAQAVSPAFKLLLTIVSIGFLVLTSVQVWLTWTVYRCFKYLRINARTQQKIAAAVQQPAAATGITVTTTTDEYGRTQSLF